MCTFVRSVSLLVVVVLHILVIYVSFLALSSPPMLSKSLSTIGSLFDFGEPNFSLTEASDKTRVIGGLVLLISTFGLMSLFSRRRNLLHFYLMLLQPILFYNIFLVISNSDAYKVTSLVIFSAIFAFEVCDLTGFFNDSHN